LVKPPIRFGLFYHGALLLSSAFRKNIIYYSILFVIFYKYTLSAVFDEFGGKSRLSAVQKRVIKSST
jgi:hypothetical protein